MDWVEVAFVSDQEAAEDEIAWLRHRGILGKIHPAEGGFVVTVEATQVERAKSQMVARRNLRSGGKSVRRRVSVVEDMSGCGVFVAIAAALVVAVPVLAVLDLAGGNAVVVVPLLAALFILVVKWPRGPSQGES